MIKWLKKLSTAEKMMVAIIVMLLVGIFLRREYIKKEGGESLRYRLNIESTE